MGTDRSSRLGRWWGPERSEEEEERMAVARDNRRARQSHLQSVVNSVDSFEPNSEALLNLVIQRDSLLKEKGRRQQYDAFLRNMGLRTSEVEGLVFKERETRDTLLQTLHQGPNAPKCAACPHDFSQVKTGDWIGVRARGGRAFYFSQPIPGLPEKALGA